MKIRLKNKISESATNFLSSEGYLVSPDIEDPDALLVRSSVVTEDDLRGVVAVSRAGSGTNNIPVDYCTDRGIVVFNTPGANANAVKELVIASLILVSRNIIPATQWVKSTATSCHDDIEDFQSRLEKTKKIFSGREILGATLGVIGTGAIGTMVVRSALDLGMNVVAYDIKKSPISYIDYVTSLDELFEVSDYITIHVPSTEDTRKLIDEEAIEKMKDGVFLLNFSRGEVVDEDAVIRSPKILGYVTDFPTLKLVESPKTILMPHIGASTFQAEETCALTAAFDLDSYLSEGEITHSVNYPTVTLNPRKSGDVRILIHSDEFSSPVCKCSEFLENLGIKDFSVESHADYSKGNISYTVVDLPSTREEDLRKFTDFLRKIEGFKSLRVIC